MEPLNLLREFTSNNQLDQIAVEGEQIAFGRKRTFKRTEQTAWKRGQKNTGTYSLESLVHFVKNLDKSVREYLRLPRAPGVQHVPYLERKVGLLAPPSKTFSSTVFAPFQSCKS